MSTLSDQFKSIQSYATSQNIKSQGYFTITYVLFIILALATIILMGILLRHGDRNKVILWILYALNILVFIVVAVLMVADYKLWAGIVLVVQLVINGIILLYTNNSGNLVAINPELQSTINGQYSTSWILVLLTFLVGAVAIYLKQPLTKSE